MKSICAIIKDEHRFLKEWIDWHLGLGFDAIHLFEDKGSKDHSDICSKYSKVYLRRYETDVVVRSLLASQGTSYRQFILYNWFGNVYKKVYDWVAFIDIDEFIVFHGDYTLESFCEEFEPYPAVLINWRVYNASGHIERPGCGVMDAYDKEGVFLPSETGYKYKSLCNLKRWQGLINLHRAKGYVNTNHEEDFFSVYYDKAALNHYFTKSWEDWCDRIFNRGGTLNGHRVLSDFFDSNPDMEFLRGYLINSVSHKKPNGTVWLDKKNKLFSGGNLGIINKLNSTSFKSDILIFDLGFYNGDSSRFYLEKGYKVIGVECNRDLYNQNILTYANYINKNQLVCINRCISDKDNNFESFYISEYPEWSSQNKGIAEREKISSRKIIVESITLRSLIEKFGCPDYCKIDIEGNDLLALQSLSGFDKLPKYISCELECFENKDTIVKGYPVLEELVNLGYNSFFVVDQNTCSDFRFNLSSEYTWVDYSNIVNYLNSLRDNHDWNYGLWCDIYATKK